MEGGSREALIDHLLGLKFEYYDGWDWYDDWGDAESPENTSAAEESSLLSAAGRTGFPDAIRITLAIGEETAETSPTTNISLPTEEGPTPTLPGAMVFQTIVHLNLSNAESATESGNTNQDTSNASSDGSQRP